MSHWRGAVEPLFGIAVDLTPHAVVGASPNHAHQPAAAVRPIANIPAVALSVLPAARVDSEQDVRVALQTRQRERSALMVGAIGVAAVAILFAGAAGRSSNSPERAAAPEAPVRPESPERHVPTRAESNVALTVPARDSAKAQSRASPSTRINQDRLLAQDRPETGSTPKVDAPQTPEPLAATLERLQSGIR